MIFGRWNGTFPQWYRLHLVLRFQVICMDGDGTMSWVTKIFSLHNKARQK